MSKVANEIARQIGPAAFAMLGTKNDKWSDGDSLIFAVRGSRKWNKVQVTLDSEDTYTVTFIKIGRAPSLKITQHVHTGIYVDMLHQLIENETGLRVSLGRQNK